MKKKILCFLLLCFVMVFAAACRNQQNEPVTVEQTIADLYWNVDRDTYVGDSSAGMNSRSKDADGLYSVRFSLNGEQVTYKVKKARLLEKIDSMDIMGLKINDQGVITDVYAPQQITGGEVASMCYVVFTGEDTITVSTDEALEKDYQFFDITENTGIYNVTGMDPVGHKDVAITSDRIRAFINGDGVITHIFIVERYGYWAGETIEKHCLHCDQQVQWRVWEEKNALPTENAHWILDNKVMLSGQHKIGANRQIVLDLNGYTVTGPDSKRVYAMTGENAYLSILDSSENSTGKIIASGSPDNGSVIYIRYGTFELFGGTIDASAIATEQYASAVRVNTDCTFNMYGGSIIGGKVVAPENKEDAITNSGYGGTIYVSGTMNMYDGSITGGSCVESGGNIFVGKTGTLNLHGGQITDGYAEKKGGNIAGTGKVNVYAAAVSGGKAKTYGGNFFVGNGGLLTLEDSAATVSSGEAKQGGNIYIENGAAVKINAGTLKQGHSSAHGGSIAVYGECSLGACTVAGGTATEQGGNLFVGKTGTLQLNGTTVQNGTAGTKGGNIAGTGAISLNTGKITNGTAKNHGGNIFSGEGAKVSFGLTTVSGGNANQGGNAYIDKNAVVTMTAGSWKNGQATAHGGAVAVYGTLNIKAGVVIDNTAKELGGNIFVGKTGVLNITGGSVENGTAGTKGGNIAGTGKMNLYAATISGGVAESYGGNLFVGNGGMLTLEDPAAMVTGGSAQQGGNLYIENGAAAKISAGTLKLGRSSAHGGSIAVYGECNLGACTVADGTAAEQGGNLFVGKTGILHLNGTTVQNGTAGTKGGNIAGTGTVNLNAGSVTGGSAATYGGNIFSGEGAKVTFGSDQVNVGSGTAKQGGNAYIENGAEITVNAGSIHNGSATAHGGAVAIYGKLTINAGILADNTANEQGGNLFVGKTGILNISGGCIKNGVAGTKGGNIAGTGQIHLQDGKIVDGSAKEYGGNIFVSGTVNMSGGSILGGQSANGGSIAVNGAAYIMTGGTIQGGQATQDGGSVYIARNVDSEGNTLSLGSFTMRDGEISGGTASRYGGNIFNGKECTFVFAGGKVLGGTSGEKGGNINLTGTVVISGGTVSGGSSKNGGNINSAGTLEIHGGEIFGGEVSNSTKYDRNIFVEGGNITLSGGTVSGGVRIKKTTGAVLTGKPNISNDQNLENLTLDTDITISLGDLTEGAVIGINPALSEFATDAAEGDASYFTCDKKAFDVVYQDGKLVLKAGIVDWTATDSLPTTSGKYRLTAPVTLSAAASTATNAEIYLDLNGQTITGTNNTRIYVLNDGTTLTITDTSAAPGTILCTRDSTADAGAIYLKGVRSQFNLESGTLDVSGVSVKAGAAVYVAAGASFNMSGGTITGGTATGNGGNIYVAAKTEFYNAGVFNISGGTVQNGTAATGGNVCALGVFEMTDGTITGGTATSNETGGNVYTTPGSNGASFTMTGGSIHGLVRVNSSGSVVLGGTAKISGGSTNLTLSDKPARLETTGFSEGAEIYVNPEYNALASENMHFGIVGAENDATYIKLDIDGMVVVADSKLYLKPEENQEDEPQNDVVDWTSADSLPTESGKYRLTAPVVVSKAASMTANAEIYLDLNGQTVTGTNNTRIYVLNAGCILTIDDTATGGTITCVREKTDAEAGAIYLKGAGAKFTLDGGVIDVTDVKVKYGAAVYVAAGTTFIMNDGILNGGEAAETGGSIYVQAGATAGQFNMTGGTIKDGKAKQGGNIYVAAGSSTNAAAIFQLSGGTISGGEGTTTAGNVAALGVFSMSGGEITGGICNVSGNHKYAANLYILPDKNGCSFSMTGGTISGGVRVNNAGNFTLGGTAKITTDSNGYGLYVSTNTATIVMDAQKPLIAGAEIWLSATGNDPIVKSEIATEYQEFFKCADGALSFEGNGNIVAVTANRKLYLL